MSINIRKLIIYDYNQYINLINQLRPIGCDITYETFIKIYEDIFKSNIIFVAEIDNILVGSITLLIEQKFIHKCSKYVVIEDVVVDNTYRGKNIGKQLVEYAVNYAKDEIKAFKIRLTCKEYLIPFYSKNNFEVYDIHMSQLL